MKLDENNLPKEIPLGKAFDYKGKKIGKITILYRSEYPGGVPHTGAYWVGQCECGNYTWVRADHIRREEIKSCGEPPYCSLVEDLTNKKFNKLTPMYRANLNGKRVFWHCKCECGNEIDVRADHLIDSHTTSCGCSVSLGEEKIIKILKENNIAFQTQKTFDDCIFPDTLAKAKFDFYLIDYNTLIGFDGLQHFSYQKNSSIFTKEKTDKIKEHDEFKNEYCLKNNINLIRIPYTHYDSMQLEDLLPLSSSFLKYSS